MVTQEKAKIRPSRSKNGKKIRHTPESNLSTITFSNIIWVFYYPTCQPENSSACSIFLLEKRSWWIVPLCDSSSRLRAVLFEINGEHSPSVISSSRNPVTPVGYWRPVKSSSRNRHSSSTTTVRSSSTIQHREILRSARACLFIVYIARNTGRSRTRVSHVRATLASLFLSLRPRSGTLALFLKKLLKNEDSRAIFYEKAYFLKRTKGEFLISISYIRPPLPLYDCIRYVLSSENTRKVQSQHLIFEYPKYSLTLPSPRTYATTRKNRST